MANVTIATTDTWIAELWSTQVYDTLHNNVVLLPLQNRDFEKQFDAKPGDTIRVPAITAVTARTLTNMTGTLTFDAATEAATTNIAINTLAYHAQKIDRASNILNYVSLTELYAAEAGIALAIKVDTDIGTALDGTTNTKGTDNVVLTDEVLLDSRQVLDTNNVAHDSRYLVVSPKMLQDMFQIDKYVNSLYNASIGNFDTAKGRGFAGRVYDFDVYETTNLPSGTSGKKGFMFHRSSNAVVMAKDIAVERRQPHDELADAIITWTVYGIKLMAAARCIEVDGR